MDDDLNDWQKLPDSQNVVRLIKGAHIDTSSSGDGQPIVAALAFIPRVHPMKGLERFLSCEWLEYFTASETQLLEAAGAIRQRFSGIKPSYKLGVIEVGAVHKVSSKLQVLNRPADSKSGIFGLVETDRELAHDLAQKVRIENFPEEVT
jgi:hypothetical protein